MVQSAPSDNSVSPFGGALLYPPFPPQLAKMHTHTACEIFCVFRGTGYYVVEGTQHKLEHGKIILLRPGEVHRVVLTGTEPYDRFSYHFNVSDLDALDPEHTLLSPFFDRPLGEKNVYTHSAAATTRIYDLFARLRKPYPDDYSSKLNASIALYGILVELKNMFDANLYFSPDQTSDHIRAVLEYVNNHLTAPLSVDSLCQRFFSSRSQLNREFKRATGTTVWDYIMSKRLLHHRTPGSASMYRSAPCLACHWQQPK